MSGLRDALEALAVATKGQGGESFRSLLMNWPSITPENVERLCRAYAENRGWQWGVYTDGGSSGAYRAFAQAPAQHAQFANAHTPAEALAGAVLRALAGEGG